MSDVAAAWEQLTTHLRSVELLEGLEELLGWDQQTVMPPKGAPIRGEQSALVSRLAHDAVADPRVGEWLRTLEQAPELSPVQAAAVRVIRRRYDRATKVPSELIGRIAQAASDGFTAWVQAKEQDDFAAFAPHLERLLDLVGQKGAAIDPDRHVYDVLLEGMDPGVTVDELRGTFARLRDGLTTLIEAIEGADAIPPLDTPFDLDAQLALNEQVAAALGYDLDAGRLDAAEHPFTVGMGPGDVRITTHLYEDRLLAGLGATIHEAGHALYEQGLPTDLPGTLLGRAASFGLHESQSRFWENRIARSRAFCRWLAPQLREHLGPAAPGAERLYAASNRVEPGLIRVQADEVTYNLHVIVRFELELALFEGRLEVADLPAAWNERYREYLGIEPPDDARGVLQDVHWASGAFAYFPSYTLGNLYGASLGAALEAAHPSLDDDIEAGRFDGVRTWLHDNVHARGHMLEAPDLVADVVGDRDMVADLLDHLWSRHGALYGVRR